MAKGDFLRALYDDSDMTWYTSDHHKVAQRKFVKEDGEEKVFFLDASGNRIGVAREFQRYENTPYVEFKDWDGNVRWRAYIEFNLTSDPNISIYRTGSKVEEIFIEKKKMDRILEDYRRAVGGTPDSGGDKGKNTGKDSEKNTGKDSEKNTGKDSEKNTGKDTGKDRAKDSREGARKTPPVPPVEMALPNFAALFGVLGPIALGFTVFGLILGIVVVVNYSHLYTVYRYAYIIVVYASCPVMALLFLLVCRIGKQPSRKRWIFWLGHLILFVVGFLFLAYWNAFSYNNFYGFHFFPQIRSEGMLGFVHFLMCFAPVLAYGLISGIWTLLLKHDADKAICKKISFNAMTLMCTGSLICTICTQLLSTYYYGLVPGSFGNFITIIFVPGLLAIFVCLASAISMLPYYLVLRK